MSSDDALSSQSSGASDDEWGSQSDDMSLSDNNNGMYSDRLSNIDSQGHTKLISSASAASGASAASYASHIGEDEYAEAEMAEWDSVRRYLFKVIDTKWFGAMILTLIFINTVIIAVQTDSGIEMSSGWYLNVIDNFFLGIYVFELFAKLYVFRGRFRKSGWNLFDAFIVVTSFIEYVQFLIASTSAVNPKVFRLLRVFRAIRALRALRVLRTIHFLDNLQVIVNTLLSSIPAMGNVILLLLLIMYIFSLIGASLYGDVYPSRFGTLFRAFFTMFQLITLDDWFGHYAVLREHDPFSLLYFLAFIILATFILVNLFIAVLVSSLEASQKQLKAQHKKDDKLDRKEKKARLLKLAAEEEKAKREDAENNAAGLGKPATADSDTSRAKKAAKKQQADRTIDSYYPPDSMPSRQRQLTGYYFMLLASLESTHEGYLNQQRMLDELVDATTKTEGDDEEA